MLTLPGTSVRSEFETIDEMKTMPNSELYKMGLSFEDVQVVKGEETRNIILQHAATLTNNELKEKGLSDETIQNIKEGNFENVTEYDVQRASSKLAFNIASVWRGGTSANYNIYWHWDVEPSLKYRDSITSAISDGYHVNGTSTALLYYNDEAGVLEQTEKRKPPTQAHDGTCEFTFDMREYTEWGPRYCAAGKAFVATSTKDTSPDWALIASADYYHSYQPEGFEISLTGGPISVYGAGSHEGEETYYIDK